MTETSEITSRFSEFVIPSYGRSSLVLDHGKGSRVWDTAGKEYLDLGGGIAVNSLGHCHPAITEALHRQSQRLIHVSNLYYHELQGRLAERIVALIGPGKCFFSNSGAEANEGLFKLARKFGNETGRYEVITALNSFHGRTLAGIAATGQEKVKKGFEPAVEGFKHVPYNDLAAMEAAITSKTAAILIEGVQGEGGVVPAAPAYLKGLRALCDRHGILLLMDGVQCGHFRTGCFQSFMRILEDSMEGFLPDGISMAKSLGGGFPIGGFWVRKPYADLLGPGTHATTYGGNPLGCAVALTVLEVIEREDLARNVRETGDFLTAELARLVAEFPGFLRSARGIGFMTGLELAPEHTHFMHDAGARTAAMHFAERAYEQGLLLIPAGTHVVRMLPALNLSRAEVQEAIGILRSFISSIEGAKQ